MPNFNQHVQPLRRETLPISTASVGLSQALIDDTAELKSFKQYGNKRRKARVARIYIDTANSIRFTVDGTAPVAATTGALGRQFDVLYLESYAELCKFRAIRDGGTDSSIQVEYFG